MKILVNILIIIFKKIKNTKILMNILMNILIIILMIILKILNLTILLKKLTLIY